MAPAWPRRSIPTRIFAAFAGTLALFAAVATVSVVQHQRTASTLRLLNEGYLPLSLSISEARATQGAFSTMVDRPLDDADTTATKKWLEVARRVRPITLRHALDAAERAERLAREPQDEKTLARIRSDLEAVMLEYELAEDDFEALAAASAARDPSARAAARQALRGREQQIQRRIASAWAAVRERIATTTTAAREDERRALGLVVGLGLVALAVGLALAWWSQRLLAPLPRLQERVAAVARGDLSSRIEHHAQDEIGVVAAEFERMVDALAQRDDRLRKTERLAAIGKLAAHVTHEVRNPLSSIRLNVEMLEEDVAESVPEAKGLVASVRREVDRLTSITEQYLRLARLPEPQLSPGDVGEVVHELSRFTQPEMERAGVALKLRVDEPLPQVAIDEPQLRQALFNLLRNAREAMPEGGEAHLQVSADDAGHGVYVRLFDQGPGVTPEDADQLFDLFFTTKQHGTGLGLPLTQQIVVAHGGHITCSQSEGGGSVFEIWLPALEDDGAAASSQRLPHPAPGAEAE